VPEVVDQVLTRIYPPSAPLKLKLINVGTSGRVIILG
jgi:hypothetical protein